MKFDACYIHVFRCPQQYFESTETLNFYIPYFYGYFRLLLANLKEWMSII